MDEKVDPHKSILEILSTPTACRRNLNITYVRSQVRATFPHYAATMKDRVVMKKSKKLKDLELAETKWETYQINALYDFHYQEPMLKRYEKILKSIVNNDISKIESPSISQYKNMNFKVEIHYFQDMIFTEKDCPPVKITVFTDNDEECETHFTGILLSVGRKKGFMEEERNFAKAIILPLFLVNYTDKIFYDTVKLFLEDNFSCLVSPLKFSSCDLVWMLALFCPKNDQITGQTTVIEYDALHEELNSIEYAIDPYTIADVWNRVAGLDAEEASEDQVYEFIQILEHHFFDIFSINLAELNMRVIKTPLARVEADHSIVPYDSNKLYFVMKHLTHLAQEIVK